MVPCFQLPANSTILRTCQRPIRTGRFTLIRSRWTASPDVSGNTINGLGETEFRRPRIVYWSPDPNDIPHGDLQRWFYSVNPNEPSIVSRRAERQKILDEPLPDVAADKVQRLPAEWTAMLDEFVAGGLCEQVGVTQLDRDWLYEGAEAPFSNIIIIGVQHAYDEISKAPLPEAGAEVIHQYGRSALAAKRIGRLAA